MPTVPITLQVTPALEAKLEALRSALGLPTTSAALELLISRQCERTVARMTGVQRGPRLIVNNHPTTTTESKA